MAKEKTLGIIAGDGDYPWMIINHCREANRPFVVISFKEQNYERGFTDMPHLNVSMGAVRKYVKFLKSHDASEIILAGSLQRPNLWSLRPDSLGVKILAKWMGKTMGDDGLLQLIIGELEALTAAKVIGYEDLFGAIKWPLGTHGKHQPTKEDLQNIARAEEVFTALSQCDVGQALVVQAGLVIGVEAVEGTDKLLQRSAGLLRKSARGLLFKKMKSHQTRKADLPTIGARTMEQVAEAGLQGVVIGQNGVIILDYREVVRQADKRGLFLYVVA